MTNPEQGNGSSYDSTDIPDSINDGHTPEHPRQKYSNSTKSASTAAKDSATIGKFNTYPADYHSDEVKRNKINANGTAKLWRKEKGLKDMNNPKAPYAIAGFIDDDGRIYYLSDKDYVDVASGVKKLDDVVMNYTMKK